MQWEYFIGISNQFFLGKTLSGRWIALDDQKRSGLSSSLLVEIDVPKEAFLGKQIQSDVHVPVLKIDHKIYDVGVIARRSFKIKNLLLEKNTTEENGENVKLYWNPKQGYQVKIVNLHQRAREINLGLHPRIEAIKNIVALLHSKALHEEDSVVYLKNNKMALKAASSLK